MSGTAERTRFVQVGLKESMVIELQAEARRRALPMRTMIRSILAEHLQLCRAGNKSGGQVPAPPLAAPAPRETS